MKTVAAHLNTIVALVVALVVALFVAPLFPDEPPTFVLNIAPKAAQGQFKAIGGVAVFMATWLMYACVFWIFRRQDDAIVQANIDPGEGGKE